MQQFVKRVAKAIVSPALDWSGALDRRLDAALSQGALWTILMYHRVIEDGRCDPFQLGMCVRQSRFERQVQFLRKRFSLVSMKEALTSLRTGRKLPPRALSITFDDGYRDNLTHAFPVLKQFQAPFTLFVATGGMQSQESFWWDRVISAVQFTQHGRLDLREVGLNESTEVLSLSLSRKAASVCRILDLIWEASPDNVSKIVDQIERTLGTNRALSSNAMRLAASEVRQLHAAGVEIGAHSVSHSNLARMSVERVAAEMDDSRRELEEICGERISGFAYPGGRVSDVVRQAAQDAGFEYAVATTRGTNGAGFDRFMLKRIGMPDTGVSDLKRALGSALNGKKN